MSLPFHILRQKYMKYICVIILTGAKSAEILYLGTLLIRKKIWVVNMVSDR